MLSTLKQGSRGSDHMRSIEETGLEPATTKVLGGGYILSPICFLLY